MFPPFKSPRKAGSDGDSDVENGGENNRTVEEARRFEAQRSIALADLGSQTRDYITASEIPSRTTIVSIQKLREERSVNQPGSEAQMLFMANKTQIAGWNNYGNSSESEGGEDLPNIGDGQSHRARMHSTLSSVQSKHGIPRRESLLYQPRMEPTLAAKGTYGPLRGRGQPKVAIDSPKTQARLDRPLDPAVDPDRPYGYKGKGVSPYSKQPSPNLSASSKKANRTAPYPQAKSHPKLPSRPIKLVDNPVATLQDRMIAIGSKTRIPIPSPVLASPTAFMEAANKAVYNQTKAKTTTEEHSTQKFAGNTVSQQEDLLTFNEYPKIPKKADDSNILQVPRSEISFPPPEKAVGHVGQASSWTEGHPSPASFLSDLSSLSIQPESNTGHKNTPEIRNPLDRLGLGIDLLLDDTLERKPSTGSAKLTIGHSASLMDSAIEPVSTPTLAPMVITHHGRQYIHADEIVRYVTSSPATLQKVMQFLKNEGYSVQSPKMKHESRVVESKANPFMSKSSASALLIDLEAESLTNIVAPTNQSAFDTMSLWTNSVSPKAVNVHSAVFGAPNPTSWTFSKPEVQSSTVETSSNPFSSAKDSKSFFEAMNTPSTQLAAELKPTPFIFSVQDKPSSSILKPKPSNHSPQKTKPETAKPQIDKSRVAAYQVNKAEKSTGKAHITPGGSGYSMLMNRLKVEGKLETLAQDAMNSFAATLKAPQTQGHALSQVKIPAQAPKKTQGQLFARESFRQLAEHTGFDPSKSDSEESEL